MSTDRSFSKLWMLASMAIFIATQLIIGGWVAQWIVGRYVTLHLRFVIEAIMNLSSYFIGGWIVGVISPGVRINEPAVGAFLSLMMIYTLTWFTPIMFLRMDPLRLFIGAILATILAVVGATAGERLMGNRPS